MQKIGVVLVACVLFWAGRVLGSSRGTAAVAPLVGGAPPRPAVPVRDPRKLGVALGVAVEEAQRRANSSAGAEVRNTVHEPMAHHDARHRYLAAETTRLYPTLAPSKRDLLVQLADRNEDQFRAERAAFMLGDVTEDEYVAALKQMMRDGVGEAKSFLSREEFMALEGNPDFDPFDERAHDVPGRAPYVSPEEAAAMSRDPGHALEDR